MPSPLPSAADLDVPVPVSAIQRFYSGAAPVYDDHTATFEAAAKERGIALLARAPGERYLEVAVGTGGTFGEILSGSGVEAAIGVDLAPGMLAVSARRLRAAGVIPPLALADAGRLPFADAAFDCLLNSFMLDLIPNARIPEVVAEFQRVLRPGGRLVLVNLTEGEGPDAAFSADWKRRFTEDPIRLGACRPVRVGPLLPTLGFRDVHREYIGGANRWPAEVVRAIRAT